MMFNKRINLFQVWNSKAERYDDFLTKEGDVYQQEVNWPALKDMLGDVTGKTILDAILMPLQQLLEIAARVTGFDWASDAAKSIAKFRADMGVNVTTDESGKPLPTKEPWCLLFFEYWLYISQGWFSSRPNRPQIL